MGFSYIILETHVSYPYSPELKNILWFGKAAKTFCSERVTRVLCLHAGTSKTQTEEMRKKEVEEVKEKEERCEKIMKNRKSGWSTEEKEKVQSKNLGYFIQPSW